MGDYSRDVPAMSGLALPVVPVPRRMPRLRFVAAGCTGVAAFLALAGSFLPLYTGSVALAGQEASLAVTGWGLDVDQGEPYGAVPTSGYLLVFATGLLIAATVLCGMAALPAATPGTPRAAGLVTVAAVAFLTGAVWAIGMEVAGYAESFRPIGAAAFNEEATTEHGPGIGIWLLVAAVVIAVAGMVLVLRSTRAVPTWQDQANLATPRHGFPIPVQPPPPSPPGPWAAPTPTQAPKATGPETPPSA